MKSPSDTTIPLSILNITGPIPRLSLDPATHCTNVLFSILKEINCMDFRHDMHTEMENILKVINCTWYFNHTYCSKCRITDIKVTTKYANGNVP